MNYIVLDTETVNDIECPIAYDCSWIVVNENREVLKKSAYVVAEIFLEEKELMQNAYYSDKIPQYWESIKSGDKVLKKYYNIRKALKEDCEEFEVCGIIAHNMPFDYKSCTNTQRWLTKSKYRYFYPYGVELWDTLTMARQTFGKDKDYKDFCLENGFCYGNGTPRMTAEVLYRYITQNTDFIEEHIGLDDALIEKEIFFECLKMNKDVIRSPW